MTAIRVLVPHPHVRIELDVLGGSPYVVGSRVPVRRLWKFYSEAGFAPEKLVKLYPHLTLTKVFDALSFALDNVELIADDIAREQAAVKRSADGT